MVLSTRLRVVASMCARARMTSLRFRAMDEDCALNSILHSVFGVSVQSHEFRLRGCSHDVHYGDDVSCFVE